MKRTLTLSSLLAALIGCAPMTVQHDYDPDVDFSAFSTFDWMPRQETDDEAKSTFTGPFLEKRIKKSVVERMAEKGYDRTSSIPDLLIAYHVNFKKKAEVSTYGSRYGYGYWGRQPVEVRRFKEGTLILDFVDPDTKQLVWRGWSISAVHPQAGPEEEQENINRAVEEILKRFPPYPIGGAS